MRQPMRSVPHCSRQKVSCTKPETTAQRPRWLAEEAVHLEPVSASDSLLTAKLTGNFAHSGPRRRFSSQMSQQLQQLGAEFPSNGTANVFAPNSEFLRKSRELQRRITEVQNTNVTGTGRPIPLFPLERSERTFVEWKLLRRKVQGASSVSSWRDLHLSSRSN